MSVVLAEALTRETQARLKLVEAVKKMSEKKCEICKEPCSDWDMHEECCDNHEWCKHGCLRCGISEMEAYADMPDYSDDEASMQ